MGWLFVLQGAELNGTTYTLGVMAETGDDGSVTSDDMAAAIAQIKSSAEVGGMKLIDKPVSAPAPFTPSPAKFSAGANPTAGRPPQTGGGKPKAPAGPRKTVTVDMVAVGYLEGNATPVINFYSPMVEKRTGGFTGEWPAATKWVNSTADRDAFRAAVGFGIEDLPAFDLRSSDQKKRSPEFVQDHQAVLETPLTITVEEKTYNQNGKEGKRFEVVAYN